MTTLYVQEQGAVVRRSGQRLIVYRGQEAVRAVRLRDLERVALFGNVELSAPAMNALLEAGIETCLLSTGGKFRGRLAPAEGKNIFLRRQQFHCCESPDIRIRTARAILASKISNARYVLQRHQQNHPSQLLQGSIADLERSFRRILHEPVVESMLGIEGNAACVYFAAFGTMVRQEFTFTTRSRRPPRDPVNALLSFGYTLLTTELSGALAVQGLDPQIGMLHTLDYGRPSLALDILEEFRQPIIDRLVLSLINRRVLQNEHFEDRGERGVLLNDGGRPRFLEFYHRTMDAAFHEAGGTRPTNFRMLLRRQARRMRTLVEGNREYQPYALRTGLSRRLQGGTMAQRQTPEESPDDEQDTSNEE